MAGVGSSAIIYVCFPIWPLPDGRTACELWDLHDYLDYGLPPRAGSRVVPFYPYCVPSEFTLDEVTMGQQYPLYPLGIFQGKDSVSLESTFVLDCLGVRVVNIIVVSGFAVMGWGSGREESDWWNYTSSVHRILIKTDFCSVSHSYSLSGLTTENRFILVKTLSPGSHTCWFKQSRIFLIKQTVQR